MTKEWSKWGSGITELRVAAHMLAMSIVVWPASGIFDVAGDYTVKVHASWVGWGLSLIHI